MSDVSTGSDIWPVLLPVIVGGALAAFGGAVGPVISHILGAKAAWQTARTQKFDEMLASVYEHDHWLELKRRALVFGERLEPGPPPIYKARSIALTNFEELVLPIRKLDLASSQYQSWMARAGQKRLTDEVSSLADGFDQA